MMITTITIDGPSGAGKGTICRLLAATCGYHLLDSGALYRLAALASLQAGVDLADESAVAAVARRLAIEFVVIGDTTKTLLQQDDVSAAIREEGVGMAASKVAAYVAVREALLQKQRDFRRAPGLVADGRDMGTVVFPDAQLKIFLTASAEERARRRLKQLQETGEAPAYDRILQDIRARDEKDQSRAAAPLEPAADAIVLDSTALSIDDVLQIVMREMAHRRINRKKENC